jgi:hypothetical protein
VIFTILEKSNPVVPPTNCTSAVNPKLSQLTTLHLAGPIVVVVVVDVVVGPGGEVHGATLGIILTLPSPPAITVSDVLGYTQYVSE